MKFATLIASVFAVSAICAAGQVTVPANAPVLQGDVPVALEMANAMPFEVILRIAKENSVPLGIVIGVHPALCVRQKSIRIHASNFQGAFKQALANTGYTTAFGNGAYVLTAPDITAREAKILHFRFERFTATDATMNYASQLLNGYILTSIDGANGFVTVSPQGRQTKSFTLRLTSVTSQEIANQIVQQDGKGLWVFRPTPPPTGAELGAFASSVGHTPIHIYGYDDDAAEIGQIPCETPVATGP